MDNRVVVKNFLWRLMEKFSAQGVSLIISLILARLLDPSAYGMIALVSIFITILDVFIDSGLGTALIQKKNADDTDFSTVFYFNVIVCIILYLFSFWVAPLVAKFYGLPELTKLIRVLSLVLIISGIKNIQHAYVSRNMMFKRFFFATLGGTIGSAIIGIWLAYKGYGAWALVVQQLFNTTIDTIILWITVKWRPKKVFSFGRLKGLFSFGWKILVSSLLTRIYGNLRQILIGKYYTAEDLAFYNKGQEFPNKIVPNIEVAITNILLPTAAAEQDNKETVLRITRRAVKTSAYLIWPMMIGLAVCGKSIITLFLTERWLPAAPFLCIFCVEYAWWPISAVYNNSIKALGYSQIILKIQIILRISGIVILALCLRKGVFAIAIGAFLVTMLEFLLVSLAVKKLLKYEYKQQIEDIVPTILLAITMGAVVYLVGTVIKGSAWLILVIQIIIGISYYIIGSAIIKIESYTYLLEMFKKFMRKN